MAAAQNRRTQRGLRSGSTYSTPAPIGGWNARDPLAEMPEQDAVILDNFFPEAAEVSLRKGVQEWTTGFDSPIRALLPWNSGAAKKLFAATNTGIYDATSAGAVGAKLVTVTSGDYSSVNFSTAGGNFLVAVNGANDLQLYDGTTWKALNATSTPAITGKLTSQLSFVTSCKERLWFVGKNSLSAWYLPTKAIGGALTEFPVGQFFTNGGSLIAIGSWSIDGGNGQDDYTVFVSSEGELLVYQGSDPSALTSFSKIGGYYVGEPIGKNCLTTFGGDLLYLSQQGLLPLSKLLQSSTINYQQSLTDKIDSAFAAASNAYGNNSGWCTTVFPSGNLLIINVPVAAGYAHQYVMNTVTKAWCRFTGINANVWCVFDKKLFLATDTCVAKGWTGTNDFGADIQATAQCAYTYARRRGLTKHYKLVRPIIRLDREVELRLGGAVDYKKLGTLTSLFPGDSGSSFWNSAQWDTSVWVGGMGTEAPWESLEVYDCHAFSLIMQLNSNLATFAWVSTDYLYQIGSVL